MRLPEYELLDTSICYAPNYQLLIGMQNQYRDPPPYPGHSKHLQAQPGLRQSFSGSETSTDVSVSSTENLATLQRQEPQGEENQSQTCLYNQLDLNAATAGNSDYSILARLGMPTTTVELQPNPGYLISGASQGKYTVHSEAASTYSSPGHLTVPQWSPQMITTTQQQVSVSRPIEHNPNLISAYRTIPTYVNSQWSPQWCQEQNSHLVPYMSNLPPPPEYPGPKAPIIQTPDLPKPHETKDKIELTKSQPDLSRLAEPQQKPHIHAYASEPKFPSSNTSGDSKGEEIDHLAITARTTQMIEMLSGENRRLREELEVNYKKVSKLQKFEFEIQKVHEAYESLVKSSEKRERLEAAMKKRLEEELRKMRAENLEMKEKLEKVLQESQRKASSSDEATIGKLLAQNKELLSLTRRDQKTNLKYLDTTSVSAQETDLRSKLENEIDSLKAQQNLGWKRKPSDKDSDLSNITVVQRLLSEKDSRIHELEAELTKCEQRCLEESAMRQLAVEDSVGSKDGRLAALEKSSAEREKMIDEAKSEKLKHMEELYQANRKVAELEAKVKSLQTQLSEKEGMIKVLQRSPMTRSSSVHTIYCSPLHSPRPSIISSSSSLSRQSSQSDCFRDYPTIKHVKTGSASAVESRSVHDDLREKFRDLQTESKDHSDDSGQMLLWQV